MSVESVIRKLIADTQPEERREDLFRELDDTTGDDEIRYDATGNQLDSDGNRLDAPSDYDDESEFVEVEGDDEGGGPRGGRE